MIHGECCEFQCLEHGESQCFGHEILLEAELRFARNRLENAKLVLRAARDEWAQAHLTDAESEDARQRVLTAELVLRAAVSDVARLESI